MTGKRLGSGARPPRRGITMIETLILVTCVGIMLGLVAITIQVMLRLVADSQSRFSSSVTIERLARQLRSDVHRSEIALIEDAKEKASSPRAAIKLEPEPGRSVTYKLRESFIDRDESAAGKRVRHESFMLPRGQQARFVMTSLAGRRAVSLLIEPTAQSSSIGLAHSLEVLAVVGKHRDAAIEKREASRP